MISFFFLLMLFSEFISASSQMLLKKSAGKEYKSFIREYLNGWVICGYGLLFLAMIIAIICYSKLGYMGTVVLEPVNYILVMVMSRVFFKEKITKKKLLGSLLIVCGILIFYGMR